MYDSAGRAKAIFILIITFNLINLLIYFLRGLEKKKDEADPGMAKGGGKQGGSNAPSVLL